MMNNIMTQEQEDELIYTKIIHMMKEGRQKLMSYLMIIATRNLVDLDLTDAQLSQHPMIPSYLFTTMHDSCEKYEQA